MRYKKPRRKVPAGSPVHGGNPAVRVQETVKATHIAVTAPERAHATAVPTFERLPVVLPTPIPILEEGFEIEFDNGDDELSHE